MPTVLHLVVQEPQCQAHLSSVLEPHQVETKPHRGWRVLAGIQEKFISLQRIGTNEGVYFLGIQSLLCG
jgi:hypothetical protein